MISNLIQACSLQKIIKAIEAKHVPDALNEEK